MALGIIGGTSLFGTEFFKGFKEEWNETEHGKAYLLTSEGVVFIPRHGKDRKIPPHRINHRANIKALEMRGIKRIIGINSVGSLRKELNPGSIVVPDDYIALCNIATVHDEEIVHITPVLDEWLRQEIAKAAREMGIKIIPEGIYFQSTGPRLETRAEINLMKNFADLVGMSLASEATLAQELGIGYASICAVDNYANGIVEGELDFEKVVEEASRNRVDLKRLLLRLIEELK
ncbi:MAG: MTAP family purine nucleoside phosphorylase [Candidatus Altiarchaeota archaeon]|nr:MTAP family purine nucleoside phosphorylase [Candidatus Altiarchaeota archaeon]